MEKPGWREGPKLRLPPPGGIRRRTSGLGLVLLSGLWGFRVMVAGLVQLEDPEYVIASWETSDVSNRSTVDYPQLSPGDHLFHVQAANNDGVWNDAGAQLAFTALPPGLSQSGWFRLGTALLLIGVVGAVARWRFRRQARQVAERERTANEIRELAGRLIHAQEAERHRIARELHDDFSQRLALLAVEMELLNAAAPAGGNPSAPKLVEMANRVKELSSEVHRLAYELHPAKLDQLGLVSAARGLCRELSKQSGVSIEFEAGSFPADFPPDLALCLYRILQESLQNVVRHSGATEAHVALTVEAQWARLAVSDSGRGFDVDRGAGAGGLGLLSMRERARLVRGILSLTSEPGRGTRLEARVPLARNSHG